MQRKVYVDAVPPNFDGLGFEICILPLIFATAFLYVIAKNFRLTMAQTAVRGHRPIGWSRSGREAERSHTIRVQLAKTPSFRNPRPYLGPDGIGRGWSSFVSLRDPAAIRDGRATRPGGRSVNNCTTLYKRMHPAGQERGIQLFRDGRVAV